MQEPTQFAVRARVPKHPTFAKWYRLFRDVGVIVFAVAAIFAALRQIAEAVVAILELLKLSS